MGAYVIRRVLQMLFTLFLISIISFLIVALAPGDPYSQNMDPNAKPADAERQRDKVGYDDPVFDKYVNFYSSFFQDGTVFVAQKLTSGYDDYDWKLRSMHSKSPILPTMWRKMFVTLPLVILTLMITWSLSFPVGVFSAINRGTIPDKIVTVLAYTLIAMPGFWIALMVIDLVSNGLGKPIISPVTQGIEMTGVASLMDRVWHVGVPGIIGALSGVAILSRYVKGQMLEVEGQDYIRTAKAKGLDGDIVHYKHALRNASLPFVTMLSGLLPALFGGSVVFESIYGWPGLGRWVFEAVFNKDIFIVVTSMFVGSGLTLIGILISDLLYSVVDPRVKLA